MSAALFSGELVRLAALNPEEAARGFHQWNQDADYILPLDGDPPRLYSLRQHKEWEEKWLEKEGPPRMYSFAIRTLAEDKPIGFVATWDINWNNGESFVSIGIGEAQYRSRGYGTDAMRLMLAFCFRELNLRRVSLFVFETNERGQRSYRKNGFVVEGKLREAVLRDGQRWSWVMMGVLRQEWEALQVEKSR